MPVPYTSPKKFKHVNNYEHLLSLDDFNLKQLHLIRKAAAYQKQIVPFYLKEKIYENFFIKEISYTSEQYFMDN